MQKNKINIQKDYFRKATKLLCGFSLFSLLFFACNTKADKSCCDIPPKKAMALASSDLIDINAMPVRSDTSSKGMVRIPAGTFQMGADNEQADKDEYPKHKVQVDAFWMDATEATNIQFQEFIKATKYLTTAEQKIDWEELKKDLPPGTPKPPDDVLVPGSLVFTPPDQAVPLTNVAYWWSWVTGASWQHPTGPDSDLNGKEDLPVVHISWDDAYAYCKWQGKRLPTEAEWEWAARGGLENNIYPWGNEHISKGTKKANSWEGTFPHINTEKDGYYALAPIRSYAPNPYGLYDMAGNVWEWCSDWYHANYYEMSSSREGIHNPQGPNKSYDPDEPYTEKKVQRGGSFLCNDAYCSGYRVARRMKSSKDTGLMHAGCRCVK